MIVLPRTVGKQHVLRRDITIYRFHQNCGVAGRVRQPAKLLKSPMGIAFSIDRNPRQQRNREWKLQIAATIAAYETAEKEGQAHRLGYSTFGAHLVSERLEPGCGKLAPEARDRKIEAALSHRDIISCFNAAYSLVRLEYLELETSLLAMAFRHEIPSTIFRILRDSEAVRFDSALSGIAGLSKNPTTRRQLLSVTLIMLENLGICVRLPSICSEREINEPLWIDTDKRFTQSSLPESSTPFSLVMSLFENERMFKSQLVEALPAGMFSKRMTTVYGRELKDGSIGGWLEALVAKQIVSFIGGRTARRYQFTPEGYSIAQEQKEVLAHSTQPFLTEAMRLACLGMRFTDL